MRYPKPLKPGDTIGICAPSSGVKKNHWPRLNQAIANLHALGYKTRETSHLRGESYPVCPDASIRAAEFMSLYAAPDIAAIIPPWGGELLMEILPLLDFDRLLMLPPKWVAGYSDITTLTFPLTLRCDIATIHGSNLMNMGWKTIHPFDQMLLTAMSETETEQHSAGYTGSFARYDDFDAEPYFPTTESAWKSLFGEDAHKFSGRMISGCTDVLSILAGTTFAPVKAFVETYRQDGIIWALESCELDANALYRALWQMRYAGWFSGATGILIGRPDGFTPHNGLTHEEVLRRVFKDLNIPVLYDVDVGHIPPQLQLVNGAMTDVAYAKGAATVMQRYVL